jgi:cysteinyl-tRNA synthetase
MLHLYNTKSQQKEVFTPLNKDEVTIYSCGPTVYDFAHIGNFRSFLMSDLLVRVLKFSGFNVKKVQNITDVGHLTNDDLADSSGEDKISKKAKLEHKDPYQIARFYETAFIADEQELRILPPNFRPRATEYIQQQLNLIKLLISRDFAYKINGSVYFRTKKFQQYGQLSNNNLDDLIAGVRVEINSEKEDPLDFALWKKADKNHLMQWNYETGEKISVVDIKTLKSRENLGFPGWHIECSAMSLDLLGENFDIHTGGEDNVFPHHECEIAQNECSHGGKINYWLHAKHLLVDGQKMSKSKNNFYTIKDLLAKNYTGNVIRYALLNSHYRTALNFSLKSLDEAKSSIDRIENALENFQKISKNTEFRSSLNLKEEETAMTDITKFRENFKTSLQDDLNIAPALAAVFSAVKWGQKKIASNNLTSKLAQGLVNFIEQDFNQIFDVLTLTQNIEISAELSREIEQKIIQRNQARTDKNWELADQIRDELLAKNIEIIDKKDVTTWRIKK